MLSGNSKAEEEVLFVDSQKGNLKIRSTYLASPEKGPVTPLCEGKTVNERQRLVETWNYERETGKLTVESRKVVMRDEPVESVPFASMSVSRNSPTVIIANQWIFVLATVPTLYLWYEVLKQSIIFYLKLKNKQKKD